MKNKQKNRAMVIFLLILGIIVIGSFTLKPRAGNSIRVPIQTIDRFGGHSEYYYKPAGDSRIWHIVNIYSEYNPLNDDFHNMSYYDFNSDSVLVINQYAVMPNQNLPEVDDANFSTNYNNFNN